MTCGGSADKTGAAAGGFQWSCEHRQVALSHMPGWRREVRGSQTVIHLESFSNRSVSFGRSVERRGRLRRAGYVLINNDDVWVDAQPVQTGLPRGRYIIEAMGYRDVTKPACYEPIFVDVDWRGTYELKGLGPREAIIMHTGMAELFPLGVGPEGMIRALLAWAAVLLLPVLVYTKHPIARTRTTRPAFGPASSTWNSSGGNKLTLGARIVWSALVLVVGTFARALHPILSPQSNP